MKILHSFTYVYLLLLKLFSFYHFAGSNKQVKKVFFVELKFYDFVYH